MIDYSHLPYRNGHNAESLGMAIDGALQGFESLLALVDDPKRDGLRKTPERAVKAFLEMTAGYAEDPATILSTVFDQSKDEMIILAGIEFSSLCEHHLLPFFGSVSIGYLPGTAGKVVGISKLARLVECFARRLQIQERMTDEIAFSIEKHLKATGVAVVITAKHQCMACRGVRKSDASMITSTMLGVMRDDHTAKQEFLQLTQVGK